MKEKVLLETVNLTKTFGEVRAVNKVGIKIYSGEIRGLIGENGSGKSTVSSMLSGLLPVTDGEMFMRGAPYRPRNTLDARDHKVSMIVQETGTIHGLSIAENIFLGDEARFSKGSYVDRGAMHREAKKALELIDMGHLDPGLPIQTLNFEERKLIEIARALYHDPSLIIVDETTTALSHEGREMIHRIMRKLKQQDKAVLFISHDLPELMDTCDALTVMRDGNLITTIERHQFNESLIKKSMVGREIEGDYYRSDWDGSHDDQVMISVDNVSAGILQNITIQLHKGEILGVGGLSGSGMHELGKLMYGDLQPGKGTVTVYGPKPRLSRWMRFGKNKKTVSDERLYPSPMKNIQTAIANKVGYVSKNRDQETLIMEASIKTNLTLSALDQLSRMGFIMPATEKKFAKEQIEGLNIKASSMNQTVGELSGGNKQKVSFGKWIGNDSRILILDSPTRGVDVGVKTTMYRLLYSLKKQGYSILIISEELPELIGMSDRILMMKDGRINKEFVRSRELDESSLIEHMI
ncbi:sugar ABC transporter ATP-binding protein [Cohnella cholangitidis]|uniref:Sugar ABC transporter ATP-binding protein n=1 Tax=Cohnella cholangitidis TaxID=2598458 RepID=A0A7G5C479_9BACL|nr:sugar ABC transporter ATP-binding protein [Cohnella cholangitidis]QMV44013.1 sugar ABC transporter ATP-binding protein [Cohnella cholangitidis]